MKKARRQRLFLIKLSLIHIFGEFLSGILDMGIEALGGAIDQLMAAAHVNSVLHSLVMDGIFNGVGSVLSFLPVIAVSYTHLHY